MDITSDFINACEKGDIEIIKKILDLKICNFYEVINHGLYIVSYYGHINILKLFLNHGASVKNYQDVYERNGLYLACSKGNLEVVKILLDNGANVNQETNFFGYIETPLTTAITNNKFDVAKELLIRGANCDIKYGTRTIFDLFEPEFQKEKEEIEEFIESLVFDIKPVTK